MSICVEENNEKSLLLFYASLSSTISSRTRSTPDFKRLVNDGHFRNFRAETYIPSFFTYSLQTVKLKTGNTQTWS